MFAANGIVDMDEQENFHQLKTNVSSNDSRHVKQKSEKWFEIRSKAMVTGSTCNTALGLGLLKEQQAHFDKVVNRKESTVQFSEQQKSNMEYGSLHEIDGVATIVGHVLPAFFPKLDFYEEGCARLANKSNDSFLVASPDGSLRESVELDPKLMFENKCKVKSKYTTPVFYEIPKYYIPQLLCEMSAYSCNSLLFSCWSKQSTTVFQVEFDDELWKSIWEQLDQLYGSENPKRPTKFSEKNKDIRTMINEYQQRKVSFLGEFPFCSVKQTPKDVEFVTGGPHVMNTKKQPVESHDGARTDNVLSLLRGLEKWFDEVYQLCRTSATEILMFMVNDLDRKFHLEINNAHPVAYALKGSSMTFEVFKLMIEHVIKKCEDKGLRVIATSSDGQWHKYGVRGSKDVRLTVYQLQKDMWKEQKSKPKSALLKDVRNRYKVSGLQDILIEKEESGRLIVLGHTRDSPLRVYSSTAHKWQLKSDKFEQNEDKSDINESRQGSDTLTLIQSLDSEHDLEEEDVREISSINPNAHEQNAVIDMHLGEFMRLMFSDTDNANYYNTDNTDELFDVNNDFRESLNTAVHLNLPVSTYDVNNITTQPNCFSVNDTEIGTAVSSAFAALSGDTDIGGISTMEIDSFTKK
ncbi:uncharacterized protein LOC132739551 [Ruditapes philippinarum]|uniref:uncharacterized protein LOC132739551 n=1 Tax=Ruditapes philippinarum TaxID=129788 RepID=UPI00295C082E|nr:uncharacterized protein LOC132739551 [Ruditapes philippinarum]